MKNTTKLLAIISIAISCVATAAPLMSSWQGSGADADKRFCEYGDGSTVVVSASQNCPASN